jgi:predicted nucleotidyltransferase
VTIEVESLGVKVEDLRALCDKWGVAKLAVFGSVARGEARPDSDIDLMVTFLPGRTIGLAFFQLQTELAELFGRDVDLISDGPIENPFRRRSIERDLTVVYAA